MERERDRHNVLTIHGALHACCVEPDCVQDCGFFYDENDARGAAAHLQAALNVTAEDMRSHSERGEGGGRNE